MRKTIAGLTAALVLMAAPVAAQDRPLGEPADTSRGMGMMQGGMMGMMQGMHGQDGMMGMMGGGMMGGMGMMGGPMMILRLEESLELSESQVERLKAIQESARTEMRQHMMQGMHAMHGAQTLLDAGSPDLAAYEAKLREGMNHMVLAHTSMAKADVDARQVLNAGQREKLALARAMMKEMRGGMMQGGMMNRNGDDDAGHRHRR